MLVVFHVICHILSELFTPAWQKEAWDMSDYSSDGRGPKKEILSFDSQTQIKLFSFFLPSGSLQYFV